ncbi:MAG: PqqD family peptide modification chaperone [Enterococcaceae bacterium]|nr:PqqD family peptide modification chaperone [Enterococcaceae bacterium]MCI1919164.1 PqqD family peptide modification chaperone [Enterococcaceae bacterium]
MKNNNFILEQPNKILFSYIIKGSRMLVNINDSAKQILLRLNGIYTIDEIIRALGKEYQEDFLIVKMMVENFLDELRENSLLEEHSISIEKNIKRGYSNLYTPEHVTLELTHNCPLKCQHCFLNAGIGKEMPFEKCEQVVTELLESGTRIFQLTGGEPFCFKKINKIISLLISEGAEIHISTSGYILNDEVKKSLEMLTRNGNAIIQVSIDGTKESHNYIRGRKDAYEKAIDFAKYSISKKISTVVATTLIHQSLEEIEELVAYLKEIGVNKIRLGLITNQGRAYQNNLKGYTLSHYKKMLVYLKEKYDDKLFRVEESEEISNSLKSCGAGYKTIKITPQMIVTPCAMMQLNIGDLKKESLTRVLERSYINFSKLEFPQKDYCENCLEEEYCHDCISESIIRKNNVENCTWEDSQHEVLNALTNQ